PLEETAGDERARARDELLREEGLRHVVVRALAQPAHAGGGASERTQHENGEPGEIGAPAQALDDFIATHPGQHEVQHHEIDVRRELQFLEGSLAGAGGLDLVPLGLEQVAEQRRRVLVVLDDQDAGRFYGAHRVTPWCGRERGQRWVASARVKGLESYASQSM